MLNTIDLFAGCGGLTEGFKKSGSFKMLAAVEWDKDAHNTLKHRLQSTYGYKDADARCLLFDIQKIEELIKGYELNEYPSHIGLEKIIAKDTLDLVIGGPPCQAYSVAGRIRDGNGMQDDYRNYLFESYMKVVDHFQPNACIFENVPGMLSAAPGGISIVDRISESFRKSGYVISNNLRLQATFDVSEFGVPQKRKRVIIAAFRDKSFENANEKVDSFYRALERHKEDTLNTVGRALSNLPKILPIPSSKAKESHKVDTGEVDKALDHEPRFHNDRDVKIFRLLAEDIEKEEYKYISTKALHALYTEKTGKSSSVHKYHVLRADQPSNTIPAHLYKDGLRHIHPDSKQARSITVREAARLQSFPDDFEFLGSNGSKYKMIGNAVPVLFAQKIAKSLFEVMKDV